MWFDVIPCGGHEPNQFTVILVGSNYGPGPQIPNTSWPAFRDRLLQVLPAIQQRIADLDKIINQQGHIAEEPIAATVEQLRFLGFEIDE